MFILQLRVESNCNVTARSKSTVSLFHFSLSENSSHVSNVIVAELKARKKNPGLNRLVAFVCSRQVAYAVWYVQKVLFRINSQYQAIISRSISACVTLTKQTRQDAIKIPLRLFHETANFLVIQGKEKQTKQRKTFDSTIWRKG